MFALFSGVNQPHEPTSRIKNFVNTDHIYKILLQSFREPELNKWYPSLDFALTKDVLRVSFPHRYFEDWFDIHVRQRFENALSGVVTSFIYQHKDNDIKHFSHEIYQTNRVLPFGAEFIFDNFLTNEKNFFPLASARQVAQSREIEYNPLVLCGQSGSGKSFLLRAIANVKSTQIRGGLQVTSMEDLHQLYTARGDARTFLLSMQFLAVDDLQVIVKYPYLQDELITIFDHYHVHDKQMVFGCATKTGQFEFLTPKLKSRLEWGLIVHLTPPDLDIRAQFAQSRCRDRGLDLSRDRILYLAQRCTDLRYLEGCVHKLVAYQELVQDPLSDTDFESFFSSLDPHPAVTLNVDRIIDSVCAQFALSREEILSASRKRDLVFARQVAMFLCRKLLGLSFPELGQVFGGKDHSTALYSCRKIEQLQGDDKNVKDMLQALTDTCLGLNEIRTA